MKKFVKVLMIIFLILCIGMTFVACGKNANETDGTSKFVPLYTGMSVVTNIQSTNASYASPKNAPEDGPHGPEPNPYPEYSDKDIFYPHGLEHEPDRNWDKIPKPEEVEEDNNFSDNNVEEEILPSISVNATNEVEYFAPKNNNIFINVHLSNPSGFVILRFTLNGTIYQNYQFESGSTSELLILKINTGDVCGIKDYTIDAIKYIDDADNLNKDVDMSGGEKVVKVGVTYDSAPTVNVGTITTTTEQASFSATLTDSYSLIKDGNVNAYLYDGEEIIDTVALEKGNNEVAFNNVMENKTYQYAIVAVYDILDGKGEQKVVLDKGEFKTLPYYYIKSVVPGKESIAISIGQNPGSRNVQFNVVALQNATGKAVDMLEEVTDTQFEDTLSDTDYTVAVYYTYEYEGKTLNCVCKTPVHTVAKTMPTVEIAPDSITKSSFNFAVNVDDPDEVGEITSIKLNDEAVEDLSTRQFGGLLTNYKYKLEIEYSYNVNDGKGKQVLTTTETVSTLQDPKNLVFWENTEEDFTDDLQVETATFAEGVTKIFSCTFMGCKNLETITLPSTLTEIESDAFTGCDFLTAVYYNGTIEQWCNINFGGQPLEYAHNLYIGDKLIKQIEIPNTVTKIGLQQFLGWNGTSIIIPDSVTTIEGAAFDRCKGLEEIIIPDSVTKIGFVAFRDCIKLSKVVIGDSVETIESQAFMGCNRLIDLTIGNKVKVIEEGAFWQCEILPKVVIPDSVKRIERDAFYECRTLTTVMIPSSVTRVGQNAFLTLSPLTAYIGGTEIPFGWDKDWTNDGGEGVKIVWNYEKYFIDEQGVEYVIFDDRTAMVVGYEGNSTEINLALNQYALKSVADYAFLEGCENIKEITLSDDIADIGAYAFLGCSGLKSLTIGKGIKRVGANAFNCGELTEINYNATECENFGENDNLFYTAGKFGEGITVNIGNNVKSLPDYLFYGYNEQFAPKITRVIFEDGSVCESIGKYAFCYCVNLEDINLPDSIEYIGKRAFGYCEALSTVRVPKGMTSINEPIFFSCSALKSVVLHSEMTSICDWEFENDYLFTTVYYDGTAEQWAMLFINPETNFNLNAATKYYYSETEPADTGNYWHYVDGVVTVWTKL